MEKHNWYYGKMKELQATVILQYTMENCFLVRQEGEKYILSCKLGGYIHHYEIRRESKGYYLMSAESDTRYFDTILNMIEYYQSPQSSKRLGFGCNKSRSGKFVDVDIADI